MDPRKQKREFVVSLFFLPIKEIGGCKNREMLFAHTAIAYNARYSHSHKQSHIEFVTR